VSRPALGPTQPPIQWVPVALSLEVKWPGVKLTTHLHLIPSSRLRGAIPPFSQYAFVAWCSGKSTATNLPLSLVGVCLKVPKCHRSYWKFVEVDCKDVPESKIHAVRSCKRSGSTATLSRPWHVNTSVASWCKYSYFS
jgi:hypothetical protein